MHFGWADTYDWTKCVQLESVIFDSGGLRSRYPLIEQLMSKPSHLILPMARLLANISYLVDKHFVEEQTFKFQGGRVSGAVKFCDISTDCCNAPIQNA